VLEMLVRRIIKEEGLKGKVDVSLVDDDEIKKLNRKFRKKDRPTDVLAFSYDGDKLLGDVIISRETARRNARRFGVPLGSEMKRLVVHGVLHVLGYDHGRKMSHAEKIYAKF